MPKLDEQISTLQLKLQQLKLRQQRIDARRQALAAQRDRKADIRRQILLGALVLDKMKRGEIEHTLVLGWLDQALTRAADRALFALPERPPGQSA